jgi:hypothetical protein
MAPSLRIPLGLDIASFEKSIGDAKSLTSSASDFLIKEFAKMQAKSVIKMAINDNDFKPAVRAATTFVGNTFDAVKPQIQAFTQATVRETTEAGLKVAGVLGGPAIKGSFQAFTAIGVPAIKGVTESLGPLASALLPIAARALVVGEAMHLVAEAVGAARAQIAEMVAIADRAANLNVTPQFLQEFEGEARKLKVTTDELDAALSNAFNATKDKSPIDVAKWEAGKERITDVELALRVYNQELAKAAGTQLTGLTLFRDADTQQQKITAVLTAMTELNKIGQQAAALDLGEKMFGAAFVDKIRLGKTSAENLLATMNNLKGSGDGIFTDALVNRAKEVDDQLKLSQDRLSRALKPAWDDLASVVLTIKGYWTDVVNLISKAVEVANSLSSEGISSLRSELAQVQSARASGNAGFFGIPRIPGADTVRSALGAPSIDESLRQREEDLQRRIAALEGRREGPEAPPKPTKGEGAAPTLKKTATESNDPFDTAIAGAEKRVATLKAETATIDESTAARERAKTVAQLEEAAKKANSAAGLKNTEVTDQQRAAIEKEAGAIQAAADAYGRAQVASQIKFDKGTAFLSQSDVAIAQQLKGIYGTDIPAALASSEAAALRFNDATKQISNTISTNLTSSLADAIDGTKTAGQAFHDFSKAVIRAMEEALIKIAIVGPAMRALQSGFNSLGIGNLIGGGAGAAPTAGLGGLPALYDVGGYTGDGGRKDAAGIVHRGEFVFDQDSVKRLGVTNLLRLQRGYESGGPVGMMPPVIPSAAARGAGGGGPITINNYSDAQVSASKAPNGDATITIRKMVDQAIGDSLVNGTGRRALGSNYGVKPFMGQ